MFTHVEDARLRAILEAQSIDPDDLAYALDVTYEAVTCDAEDEDVSGKAVEHRTNAYWEAVEAWEDESDAKPCIAALRDCWSA